MGRWMLVLALVIRAWPLEGQLISPDKLARPHTELEGMGNCTKCHTSAGWSPSTFDHEPLFPLVRGSHRRYRNACASCHLAPADYEQFTCTDCHDGEHRQSRMDREHAEVQGYRYESAACYECHPRGSKEDAEGGEDD